MNYLRKKNVDRNLTLPNGKTITLNDEQYNAVNRIFDWINEPSKPFFTLGGVAGSGKTTVIKKVIDNFIGSVIVSAPTHQAKKMIARTTKKRAETLHAICGLRPDVELADFNPNLPQFSQIAEPIINLTQLLIIDESSMINEDFLNLIRKIIEKTNRKPKVLFMGDPAQIPPIGEAISPVFSSDDIEMFWLTQIMRQAYDNPITEIYDEIRINLNDVDPISKRYTNINDNGEGVFFLDNKHDFRKILRDKFCSEESKKRNDFVKLIAWRNNTVELSNNIIRGLIYKYKKTDIVEVGDVLMGYRTISEEKMRYNIIENSCDYRVVTKSELTENELGLKGYNLTIREDGINNDYSFRKIFLIDHSDEDNFYRYGEYHDMLRNRSYSDKSLWKYYYSFRRNNMILRNLEKYSSNSERVPSDIIAKDLDYGYAITCHKAQGATYDYTFVLENDINANTNINERNRIKYVALTRPRKVAYVL